MRKFKIKYRLPVFIVLLSVIPVLIISAIAMHLNRQAAMQSSLELLGDQTTASEAFVASFYDRQTNALVYAANLQMYSSYLSVLEGDSNESGEETDDLRKNIENIQSVAIATDNRIDQIMLLDLNHTIVACPDHTLLKTKLTLSDTFMKKIQNQDGAYEVLHTEGKPPMLLMGQPVRDKSGKMLGIITRRIDITELNDYVRNLRIGSYGYLFILDQDGALLSYANQKLPSLLKTNPDLMAFAEEVRTGNPGEGTRALHFEDSNQILIADAGKEESTGWTIVAAMPLSEIYKHSLFVNRITLLVALCAGILSLFFGLSFARSITVPLSSLTENLNAIADGTLDQMTKCKGNDELSDVCCAANIMSHKLKVSYSKLETSARTDPMTGLSNRGGVYEVISRTLDGHAQAVILLDLDGFKTINDTYGHDCGDEVLIRVADILKKHASESVYPARFGGDEFFLYISHYNAPADVCDLGRQVLQEISAIHTALEHEVSVSASIGIAFCSPGDTSRETLLKKADLAMYQVKENGKSGVLVYHD
ncbi:MAG: diguanylate cyclase [Butyrivibrio sp.]|jgi:diguanylate cyclase (GGDEF)-like protein|nr:diguanylate cyclase [Butyrivibrio sp.]